jgi:hypothetical protein
LIEDASDIQGPWACWSGIVGYVIHAIINQHCCTANEISFSIFIFDQVLHLPPAVNRHLLLPRAKQAAPMDFLLLSWLELLQVHIVLFNVALKLLS